MKLEPAALVGATPPAASTAASPAVNPSIRMRFLVLLTDSSTHRRVMYDDRHTPFSSVLCDQRNGRGGANETRRGYRCPFGGRRGLCELERAPSTGGQHSERRGRLRRGARRLSSGEYGHVGRSLQSCSAE